MKSRNVIIKDPKIKILLINYFALIHIFESFQ